MSYTCPKCKEELEQVWCNECNELADHECEFQTLRHKDFIYGNDNTFTRTLHITFCDQCGEISSIEF